MAHWLAAAVLFLQLPVPLYWFVLHPAAQFWRRRTRAVYFIAVLLSWLPVTIAIIAFHDQLLRRDSAPAWQVVFGVSLIVLEAWVFWRVKRDLGGARLIGAPELSGGGEIAYTGIYARIRHPRYLGSFIALAGACMLAGTTTLWIVTAVWAVLMRGAIALEERELRRRFGTVYEAYSQRVPRFVPNFRVFR